MNNPIKGLLYLSGIFTLAATFLIILFPFETINAQDKNVGETLIGFTSSTATIGGVAGNINEYTTTGGDGSSGNLGGYYTPGLKGNEPIEAPAVPETPIGLTSPICISNSFSTSNGIVHEAICFPPLKPIIFNPPKVIITPDNNWQSDYNSGSGIYGEIMIGPITPVCRVDVPCDQPYQATVKVETQDESRVIAQFTSNKNGKFRVKLQPGIYVLVPITETFLYPRAYKQTVVVKPHNFTRVTIVFDTGIR